MKPADWHLETEGPAGPLFSVAPRPKAPTEKIPLEMDVSSIPTLMAARRTVEGTVYLKAKIGALRGWETHALLPRLETTTDPIMLWALHLELKRRGIPPALRWPSSTDDPQLEFVAFTADVHWLQFSYPDHQPTQRGWKRIFRAEPVSPAWHEAVYRQFLYLFPRSAISYLGARGLGLTDDLRQQLLCFPTKGMAATRRGLSGDAFSKLIQQLHDYAAAHPDRSGLHTPAAIANRRARIWRVHQLSGSSPTTTAHNWELLTGEALTRVAITHQLVSIDGARRAAAQTL